MTNEEILENNSGKKFDVCLANPPYNGKLHEKFLNTFLDISNIVISVQPMSYLFGGKNGNEKIKEKLSIGFTEIEEIDPNRFFKDNAIFQNKVAIIKYKNSFSNKIIINGKEIKTLNNIKKYFDDELISKFADIVIPLINENNCGRMWLGTPGSHYPDRFVNIEDEDQNAWVVQCVLLRGNMSPKSKDGKADDFYTMIPKNADLINKQFIGKYSDLIKLKDGKNKLKLQYYYKFNSKNEAYNFLNYIKSDFARACLYLKKKDVNVCTESVPWFDFSDPVFSKTPSEIDDYLFKKYNISNKIRKHIEEILPDYYGIRK